MDGFLFGCGGGTCFLLPLICSIISRLAVPEKGQRAPFGADPCLFRPLQSSQGVFIRFAATPREPQRATLAGPISKKSYALIHTHKHEKRHPIGCLFFVVAGVGLEPHDLRVMRKCAFCFCIGFSIKRANFISFLIISEKTFSLKCRSVGVNIGV